MKSGKSVNSKDDGYGGKSSKSKSSKSKTSKSKGSRRILRPATSENTEHVNLPPKNLKDQSEKLLLRRRRLHG